MNRKQFIRNSALSLSVLSFPQIIKAEKKIEQKSFQKIIPPKLNEGDTVGLIAPGSFIEEDELNESIENVESLGLKTYHTDRILSKHGYLGGTDKQRVDDINHMFENPDVKGIICTRGGYGCNRILPMIDYELIKQNPKVLLGYSDITALNYALYAQAGLVSFHGPVGISTFNEYSVGYLKQTLMEADSPLELLNSEENLAKEKSEYELYTITNGTAEGELVGGNLSIAASLLGTPYDVDYSNKIVYLEDIGEEPYRIDRMLTELLLAGHLQKAAGIALGVFVDCEIDKKKPSFHKSFRLKEVLMDRLGNLKIPVSYGLSFGHIADKYTLPFGIKAKLDTNDNIITLLESSVI
jgi:muramoyltetrapeptide carboxypeptidase